MYWMDAAGLYTAEPPTRKLRKVPEINALKFRPTFVISRAGVQIRPPAPTQLNMEAIKRQGARTDLTSPKISAKFRSDDEVGQEASVSGDTIRNYIALTQLVPELQQMVDEKKIALSRAYQIKEEVMYAPRGSSPWKRISTG